MLEKGFKFTNHHIIGHISIQLFFTESNYDILSTLKGIKIKKFLLLYSKREHIEDADKIILFIREILGNCGDGYYQSENQDLYIYELVIPIADTHPLTPLFTLFLGKI
jgi:hypothetical protein